MCLNKVPVSALDNRKNFTKSIYYNCLKKKEATLRNISTNRGKGVFKSVTLQNYILIVSWQTESNTSMDMFKCVRFSSKCFIYVPHCKDSMVSMSI